MWNDIWLEITIELPNWHSEHWQSTLRSDNALYPMVTNIQSGFNSYKIKGISMSLVCTFAFVFNEW